jgi:hypothetical protein
MEEWKRRMDKTHRRRNGYQGIKRGRAERIQTKEDSTIDVSIRGANAKTGNRSNRRTH